MNDYKPNTPYNVPAILQFPTKKTSKGVTTKTYDRERRIFISFRTFGGTERESNDSIVVENTGVVETWYSPDITADCRLIIGGLPYEILGTPENINMRNQYIRFKVKAVKGGA